MKFPSVLYCSLALLPSAISAQDKRAEVPTASGQIGINPPADPVTLVHHDSYMELQGPNTKFYTEEGSTTKWIGVNTEYLTEIETTRTTDGVTTTHKTSVPVAVTTATAASDGLVKGDISVALSPAIVDVLNSIAEEAVAACGGKRRKRQSCDVRLEFANRVQAEIGGGGRLDFDLDFLPTISAPDVAAVLEAVTGTKSKALGFFILTWIVASESHGNSEGAPKIPPAVNIPSNVASPTATTTSGCPPGAPTGTDAPVCPADDCKGPNEEPDNSKLACSEGQWKGCPCIREVEAIAQDADTKTYGDKTWYEHQQKFLQDLVDYEENSGPWCIPGAQPNSNKVPNSYCQCGDNYGTLYEVASSTFTPYNPCPYTEAPGPTLVFSTKVPTPTSAPAEPSPSCYKTAENEVVIYTNDEEGKKARDKFCKENNDKEISESDAVRAYFTDTHEYIQGEKAEFQFNAYAGKDCGTKKIVETDCRKAMDIVMDKCPTTGHDDRTLGGVVTIECQKYMFVPNRYIPNLGDK